MADNTYGIDLVEGDGIAIVKSLIAGARGDLASYEIASTVSAHMVRIFDTELGGSASSIDFSSIPATYKHLLLWIKGRTDRAVVSADQLAIRFNNDSGANYDAQQFQGTAATVNASETFGATFFRVCQVAAVGAAASRAGSGIVIIPDYLDTTFHKQAAGWSVVIGGTATGTLQLSLLAGGWRDTSAINRVTLISANAANLLAGSRATLYGLA